MKSGGCPKCGSEEVYFGYSGSPVVVPAGRFATAPAQTYVCAECGYIEFYGVTGHDLSRVKEKFTKVKS